MSRPLLVWLALAAVLLAALAELGGPLLGRPGDARAAVDEFIAGTFPDEEARDEARTRAAAQDGEAPPGLSSRALAALDLLLVWSALLLATATVSPRAWHARLRSVLTPVVCVLAALGCLALALAAVARLVLLLSLLLSPPFGTIAYLVVYGGFPTGALTAALGAAALLRAVFAGLLLASSWRYLRNRTLVALTATAFLCTAVAGLVLGLLPGILHAIADAALAILFAVLALVWAVILLLTSLPGLLALVRSWRMPATRG